METDLLRSEIDPRPLVSVAPAGDCIPKPGQSDRLVEAHKATLDTSLFE